METSANVLGTIKIVIRKGFYYPSQHILDLNIGTYCPGIIIIIYWWGGGGGGGGVLCLPWIISMRGIFSPIQKCLMSH